MSLTLTFKRGIHPDDNKALTAKIPIKTLPPSKKMYFPLTQHIGAPLIPTVSVGEEVLLGQKIADSDSFISAPLHSSVSGKVSDIGLYPHSSGIKVPTIVIENDEKDTFAPPLNTKPLSELSPKEIIHLVREAGIVGMGGAGFPTHVKLSPPQEKKIEYMIINGAECEPYLTSDHRVMLEEPEDVLTGLSAAMKVFSLKKGYIAVEENSELHEEPIVVSNPEEFLFDETPDVESADLNALFDFGAVASMIAQLAKGIRASGIPSSLAVWHRE